MSTLNGGDNDLGVKPSISTKERSMRPKKWGKKWVIDQCAKEKLCGWKKGPQRFCNGNYSTYNCS